MNRRQRQLCCKRHLPPSPEWSALSFEERATIAQAHFRTGLRQVKCRCGWFVWPWELAHETPVASGLRWVCVQSGGSAWLLRRDGAGGIGDVVASSDGTCSAVAYRRQGPSAVTVHSGGSLAECARRLVEEHKEKR